MYHQAEVNVSSDGIWSAQVRSPNGTWVLLAMTWRSMAQAEAYLRQRGYFVYVNKDLLKKQNEQVADLARFR